MKKESKIDLRVSLLQITCRHWQQSQKCGLLEKTLLSGLHNAEEHDVLVLHVFVSENDVEFGSSRRTLQLLTI